MMKKGFTLVEVIVVVVIIAVLSSIAATQLFKAVESSRMSDAVALVSAAAGAKRMARLDYIGGTMPTGVLTSPTSVTTCSTLATVADYTNCKYLTPHDWSNLLYAYYMCNDTSGAGGSCCAANVTACAQRKKSTDALLSGETSNHGTTGDYASWRVRIMTNGQCSTSCSGACASAPPSCPAM